MTLLALSLWIMIVVSSKLTATQSALLYDTSKARSVVLADKMAVDASVNGIFVAFTLAVIGVVVDVFAQNAAWFKLGERSKKAQ
jgi:hypothetical protein